MAAAATEVDTATPGGRGTAAHGILLAALALPGVHGAHADTPPERGTLAYKYLDYQDAQPGWDRIGVKANAISALLPVAGDWSIGGTLTRDVVSGASPAFHSEELLRGEMEEDRYGRDAQLTRYFQRGTLSLGITDSQESDYTSRGYSLGGSLSTPSKNTTFSAGIGTNHDRVDVKPAGITQESKDTDSWTLGVSQILTPFDIVQLQLSRAAGQGFFTDPYKYRDNRPRFRDQDVAVLRWNHHVRELEGSTRASYRYYRDTFGVSAHTLELEYVQPLAGGWTLTPELRLYAQSKADFYLEPRFPGIPTIRPREEIQSQDQRLSTFGGLTWGLNLGKSLGPDWQVDVEYERYEQRPDWYPFGGGSEGIDTFRADFLQLGVTWSFL